MHIDYLSLARRKLDAKGAHGDATVNSSRKLKEGRGFNGPINSPYPQNVF